MGEERDGSKNERKSDRNQKMEKDMVSVKEIAKIAQESKMLPPGRAKTKREARLG